MVIQAKHFDVRLNKWIHVDGNQDNQDSILQEKISNTLLERFLPGKQFSFGHMDKDVTAKQLENHPDGDKLLLSSKTRLLYGSEECLDIINQICPDRKDRGAYGSVFLGGCRTALNVKLNILIVDDSNGDNGGIINNDQAYKLTGDCYGQIATDVYHQLTGHQEGDKYRVIQHRFGWTPEDGDDNKFRFGKGTFRPANLDSTLNYTGDSEPKIDVIIPLSSFKGTDKDNPNGATKPQIKPGLYKQKVWIGEKSQSELGKTAISQVLASFPQGMKDFTETVEKEALKLAAAEKDPRKLAELYCEKYEKRKDYLESEANNIEDEISEEFDEDKQNNLVKLRERLENDSFIYKVIKADLAGDGQLLETEKVKNELTKFVQGEWRDIAIGKKLQFERALVIPSKELNNGEIYIPKYNEGEEVLNFRSPFLNSNGMCVSTNKTVEDALDPDGEMLEGIIVVSDETSERIYKRLTKQVEEILPQAISEGVKADGIEEYLNRGDYDKLKTPDKVEFTDKFNEYIKTLNEAGFDIEILPYESEQERQARDYDGDCIGFERASKYPNLTAEAIARNLPENAYAPTVKLKKASFYDEAGEQPSFEAIAKHMSDGISVGIINNHLTSIEALESEMEVIKQYGDDDTRLAYLGDVAKHYKNLLKSENWEKEHTILPDKYREYMQEFVQHADAAIAPNATNPQALALQAMAVNKTMYRELIADAAYQNQIAVDLFKSATKPDIESINKNSRLLHRKVNYIKDKKNSKAYDTETINATGYSPVELLIAKTNQYFRGSQLESRELSQFQDFFKDVEFSNQQRLQATLAKKNFDTAFNAATRFSKRRETEEGPSVELELADGKRLDVSNLLDAKHPDIWNANSIKVKVVPINEEKVSASKPHKFAVYAQINGRLDKDGKPEFSKLGNISKEQEFNFVNETGIKLGEVVNIKNHEIKPGLSERQVKLLYNQAYEIARNFYESIPEEEKQSMAAAAWAVSTTRESTPKNNEISEVQQEVEKVKKVSNFVFATFENEIIRRTDELQFDQIKVRGFNKNSDVFQQETTEIRYNIDSNGNDIIEVKNESGEYETFANLEAQAGRLPIGTTAEASVTYNAVYTATVTSQIPGQPPVSFDVGELIKYNLGKQQFNGEKYELEIECINRPYEDYVIYTKDGKGKDVKLGKIDDKSVKEGIAQDWLQKKPGQGQNLKLKITQIVSGQNGYAVGQTPDGNLLRINLDKDFNKGNINDNDYRNVTIKAYGINNVYMASINGQTLGKIGVLPRNNTPSLVGSLIQKGVITKNQTVTTIPVTIQSKQSTANIALHQETIKYPLYWAKRRQLLNTAEKEITQQEEVSNEILSKINNRPTMLFQDKEQKLAGVIGLVVDENVAENTKIFLSKKGIEYEEVPRTHAKIEAKKGMVMLMVDESTLSKKMMDIFLERASGIKSNDIPEQTTPAIAEQIVYFIDPNQEYGADKKGAIGFVVPFQNANATQSWLETRGVEVNRIENENGTTIVLATAESVSTYLHQELNTTLGSPIDVSTVEGFDKYETDSQELSETVKSAYVAASKSSTEYSEYQVALLKLPNRPKELQQENKPLPIAPSSPLLESNIEKYGEKSHQLLENKASNEIKKENQLAASSPTIVKFKGLHNDNTNQNYGGIEIIQNDGKIVKLSQSLGEGTSQQAEYQALIFGLKKVKEIDISNIKIVSDSQNTIFQLQGKYEVKNEGLKPLYNEAKELLAGFDKVEFEKISEKHNESAKILAKSGVKEVKFEQTKANIAEKFTKISEVSTLNDQQKEALNKMIAFIQQPKSGSSKDNEFLLTGYAGTGKTYVIQQLLKTLEESGQKPKICFTAPTNAAVKVLRKMSEGQGLEADTSTTHSLLGLKEQYNQITGEIFYDNDKKGKNNKYLQYDTIVVDEGSMVNKQLREKLEEVTQKGVKVIYMGDRAQLPPVKESESLVFQIENCADLTEVMRYGGDIGKTAASIRNDIENPNPAPIVSSEDGTIISLNKNQFKEEVIKLFTSEEFKQDNSSVKVLAYTNKRVDQINAFVKEELFGKDAPEYVAEMRLIARAPVLDNKSGEINVLLHNSDEMTVTQATKLEENGYKVWQLTGINEENQEITFKTIAEESKNKFAKDIQQLFSIENKKAPGDRDYPMVYAYKEQYAEVRPAYAITIHNSQGKTIKKGGVDEENINMRRSQALKETDPEERVRGIKEHNQLRYVAMTRFKEQIFVLGTQRERSVGVEDKLAQARAALNNNEFFGNKSQDEQPKQTKNTLNSQQEWARYTPKGKVGYEVSMSGDKRFSAFNAKLSDGRTIEDAYQLDVKGYRSQGNDSHLGKGKKPLIPMTREEQYQKYKDLWKQWASENPQLIDDLAIKAQGKVLTDKFANTEISQARALAEIINERATVQTQQQTQQATPSIPTNTTEQPSLRLREFIDRDLSQFAYNPTSDSSPYLHDNNYLEEFLRNSTDDELHWIAEQIEYGEAPLERSGGGGSAWQDFVHSGMEKKLVKAVENLSSTFIDDAKKIVIAQRHYQANEVEAKDDELFKNWVEKETEFIEKYKSSGIINSDNIVFKKVIDKAERVLDIEQSIDNDSYNQQAVNLPNSAEAKQKVPIEIMGTISPDKIDELRQHLEAHYPKILEDDKSNYSPGRQVAWIGAKWELNSKEFSPGVQDDKLMQLIKQVYPEADIALVTYSAIAGQGIGYHRDDSYAASEARSINIGASDWGYQAAKTGMTQTRDDRGNAQVQEFKLAEGTVTRFNSKNAHAALNTDAGRWSINIWSVKQDLHNLQTGRESVRQKFERFLQSSQPPRAVINSNKDLTIKNNQWSPGGKISVQRTYANIQDATTAQIIRIGNSTQQQASLPNIPDSPKISGKPVQMSWDLTNPDKNLNATTTIDAMRGEGRVHSTRTEDYYKKYGIKEGDIALAQGKDGSQVAFRVGKQYKITQEVVNSPDYQRAWVNWEKHDIKELTGRQADKIKEGRPLYGLFMEPLGDYVNGKIVPFPDIQQQQQQNSAIALDLEINPTVSAGLGAVLSNATDLAKKSGTLKNNYQVSVNGNPEAPAGRYGRETHEFKPTGVPYNSAEHAFEHLLQVAPDKDPYKIMVEVLQAKLEQHPQITKTIAKKGGIAYLENAQITNEHDKQWEGKGKNSKFIRALSEAYTAVIEKSQNTTLPTKTVNPLSSLKPINDSVAKHMVKDIAMAELATQFIGKSAAPPTTESSTRNYEKAWDKLANTGNYSKDDIIMVSGSGPWRGVTDQQVSQTFENDYKPLLNKAIVAKSSFVVGNAKGTDQLVQIYLKDNGYKLEQNNKGYIVATTNEKVVGKESTIPPTANIPLIANTPPTTNTNPTLNTPPTVNTPTNEVKGIAPGVIISARSSSPLGAALTSTTVKSKQLGSIDKDYLVSFRDNAAIAKGSYGPETYTSDKPTGQPFASVEQAYYVYKETIENLGEARVNLLSEIQQARFEQHPDLLELVKENGGVEWLKECTYKVGSKNDFWEGKGEESPYIRSLIRGYENAKSVGQSTLPDELRAIQINNTNENKTLARSNSSGIDTPPLRTPKKTPETVASNESSASYNQQAQSAGSTNTTLTGQKVENNSGSQKIPAFGTMDSIIERARSSTLDMLYNWQQIAQKLGKDEEYLKQIDDVLETYKNENIGIENSFLAMTEDLKEVERLNDVTRMVQRVANTVGRMDNNNVLSAKTTNGYELSIASSDKNLLVRDKPENGNGILLYIKEGQVKVNQVNDNFVKDLRMMNFTIDNALSDVRSQLVV